VFIEMLLPVCEMSWFTANVWREIKAFGANVRKRKSHAAARMYRRKNDAVVAPPSVLRVYQAQGVMSTLEKEIG
jgi:hypothetical protein